ncbi:MAG: DrmB family protein [Actinomycetota bacterium]
MAPKTKGEIRRSQLITTYGIGSIVAVEDESFMIAGIDRWDPAPPNLHEPRLERRLHVNGFRVPPASEDKGDVPVVRFPTWGHCSSCKRLDKHTKLTSIFKNVCNACGVPLIPSRFVICCANGHIDDFPYFNWVHAGSPKTEGDHRMTIDTAGNTASLSDIVIKCSCKKQATMDGAFLRHAMKGVTKCNGRRPWLSEDEVDCDEVPRVLQRGASNVWFSLTHSAISIPPWSEGAFLVLNKHWEMLRHLHDEAALTAVLEGMNLAAGTIYSTADLVKAIAQRRADEGEGGTDEVTAALKRDEYLALLNGRPEQAKDQQFVCTPIDEVPAAVSPMIDRVMVVKKLREVRVLESFSRISPPRTGPGSPRPPLADKSPGWLPAIEVNGEGVFLTLNHEHLNAWEKDPFVRHRAEQINDNYRLRFTAVDATPDRVITARLVLIHTLAHALIDQWALDSGYPASSLRERLYVSDEMAGVLLYTATSDSAGSLGGVAAQALPQRLEASFRELAARSAWCSADPLCIESGPSGVDGLNLAACHACCLVPEVSCEEMNLLLDRALLVGTPSHPDAGFLSPMFTRP